jgi:type I restriction enzyme M protein
MEACIVICRATKPVERSGKVLFINAIDEVTRENAQSFLTDAHQTRIASAYTAFADEPGFAAVAETAQIRNNNWNLSIPLYVRARKQVGGAADGDLVPTWQTFEHQSSTFWSQMNELVARIGTLLRQDASRE